MNYYTLEAVVKGKDVKFNKAFTSRKSAMDYMFAYCEKQFVYDVDVNDEFAVNGNKHNIEYVCVDDRTRFRINRIVLA